MKILYTLLIVFSLAGGMIGQNDYWFQKGMKAKKPVKKIEFFTKSLELEETETETYLNRGDVYYSIAIDALSKHKKFVIIWDKDKADFHKPKTMFEKARTDYTKAMEVDSNCTKAYLKRSNVYWQLGDNDNALADVSLLIKINPEVPEAYVRRGFLYRNNFRDPDQALIDFFNAIELDSNNIEAYGSRASTYYTMGEYEKALADYNKMIDIDPKDAYSYWMRGDLYRSIGEYDKAMADFNQSIEIDHKNFIAYNNRGLTYLMQGQFESALNDFKKAISKQPSDYPDLYNNAGYVYLQQGKINRAIKYFNKSISIRDSFLAANLNLALVYFKTGEPEKAILYLERAEELASTLEGGLKEILKSNLRTVYWTEKDKDTLGKMFEELM